MFGQGFVIGLAPDASRVSLKIQPANVMIVQVLIGLVFECETVSMVRVPTCRRDQTRPDMRPEPNPTESNPEGSGSGSASKSYTSSSGVHPSYPSNPAARVNTSEKRLTLVDSAHGDDGVDANDDNDDEGLYKTPSRRTDLDSVEAGHYQRGGMGLPGLRYDDEVIDIAKPIEVHRY